MSLHASQIAHDTTRNTIASVIPQLVAAANEVHDAAKVHPAKLCAPHKLMRPIMMQEMKSWREDSRKISKIALHIATCVENTAKTRLHEGKPTDLPVAVVAALSVNVESVLPRNRVMALI